VVGPPGLSDADRDSVVGMVQEMHDSATWQGALSTNGWTDFFKTGDEYSSFIDSEQTRVQQVLSDIGLI
jgi:putative tricarboxylic transport membrane protein